MDREQLRALQFERLQMALRWAYNNVPLYRERWTRGRAQAAGHQIAG